MIYFFTFSFRFSCTCLLWISFKGIGAFELCMVSTEFCNNRVYTCLQVSQVFCLCSQILMLMLKTKTMAVSAQLFSSSLLLTIFFCVILYSVIPKFLLLHQVEFEEFNGYFRIYVFRFQLIVEILM